MKESILNTDKINRNWRIYKLNNNTNKVAVLWVFDDDSWSIFFKANILELESLY